MASDGPRTFSYATLSGQQQVEGFVIVSIQGLQHVQTDYRVYEVDTDFVNSHNCLLVNKVFQQKLKPQLKQSVNQSIIQ